MTEDTPPDFYPLTATEPLQEWTLAELDDEARSIALQGPKAALWFWLDAVAWICERKADPVALLWGVRSFYPRRFSSIGCSEAVVRSVLLNSVPALEQRSAERALVAALAGERLLAIDVETGEPIPAGRWASGRVAVISGVPAVQLRSADMIRLWESSASVDAVGKAVTGEALREWALARHKEGLNVRELRRSHLEDTWDTKAFRMPKLEDAQKALKAVSGRGRGRPPRAV